MRKFLLALLICGSPSLFAATPSEFYLGLLQRGVAEVDAGRPANAPTLLRLAAFGLVDSIEHYEIAQVYLAVASERTGELDAARDAAQRVVAAERIERRYATLRLAQPIRTAFETLARRVLSTGDVAMLLAPPAPTATPTTTPAPVERRPLPAADNPAAPTTIPTTTTTTPAPRAAAEAAAAPPVTNDGGVKPAAPQATNDGGLKPAAPQVTNDRAAPPVTKPVQKPVVTPPKPAPAVNVPAQLTAGERALGAANLAEARRIYRELLAVQTLERAAIIRIGEGLYRARDFGGALQAFRRLGTLRAGEEAYRYYLAVALYETGDYAAAKRELAAALPHIELTPDVQRYRVRIEGAR